MISAIGRRCQTRDGMTGEIRDQDGYAKLYHVFWDLDGGYSGEWIEMGDVELIKEISDVDESPNQILDAALALVSAFKTSDYETFNKEGKKLEAMTGRPLFGKGWPMKWTIKNAAEGIIRREIARSAGNSGTH